MELTYIGPHLSAEIPDAPGIIAERNQPTHFPDDVARRLLQQPDNWAKVEKAKAQPQKNGDSQ